MKTCSRNNIHYIIKCYFRFVRLVSSDMTHTIKFKPDDNLFFTVLLPNGDIFKILLSDYFSPAMPNPLAQVSAIFRYKRIN